MAVKRSFPIKNKSQCACLKCGSQILPDNLKDNTVYKCVQCGQEMTVDRYDSHAVLTVVEKPELRRRIPTEIWNEAGNWQQAVDDLAHMIEKMKVKEGTGNV